jgi:hypothetical protein
MTLQFPPPRIEPSTPTPNVETQTSPEALGEGGATVIALTKYDQSRVGPNATLAERRSKLDYASACGDWKTALSLLKKGALPPDFDRWLPEIDVAFKNACKTGDLGTARTLIDIVAGLESPATTLLMATMLVEWDNIFIVHKCDELQKPIRSLLSKFNGWPSSSAM